MAQFVHNSPHPTYKNIIFDIGGVLVFWKPFEIAHDIFKNTNIPAKKLTSVIKQITDNKIWQEFDRGTISQKNVIATLSENFDSDVVRSFLENVHKYLTPIKEGIDIFQKTKKLGYKNYILSNMSKEFTNDVIQHYDFYKKNNGIILSYRIRQIKPEPQIYMTLLNTYSLNPKECLFIDDSEKNVIAAQNLGINSVLCSDHNELNLKLKKLNIL